MLFSEVFGLIWYVVSNHLCCCCCCDRDFPAHLDFKVSTHLTLGRCFYNKKNCKMKLHILEKSVELRLLIKRARPATTDSNVLSMLHCSIEMRSFPSLSRARFVLDRKKKQKHFFFIASTFQFLLDGDLCAELLRVDEWGRENERLGQASQLDPRS